jgi:hypothetical protein
VHLDNLYSESADLVSSAKILKHWPGSKSWQTKANRWGTHETPSLNHGALGAR